MRAFAGNSFQKESVALAIRLIDESEVRGYRLHVETARFELKGQYDASKKKKKGKDYKKRLQQQQKYVFLLYRFSEDKPLTKWGRELLPLCS